MTEKTSTTIVFVVRGEGSGVAQRIPGFGTSRGNPFGRCR